jgi:hypothetical protein
MSETPAPAAGWFPDPENAGQIRYWDGAAWTEHRAPGQPAYGASPATVASTPVLVPPLLLAGALLIVAGIGRAVSYLAPYEFLGVSIVFGVVEVIGWAGAFVAFAGAGFPSRRPGTRTVTFVLVGLYLLGGIVSTAVALNPYDLSGLFAVIGLLGFAVFGLGIAFSVSAIRTRSLTRRLAVLPGILYAGVAVFGLAAGVANAATASAGAIASDAGFVVGGLSGSVPIVIGALVLAFGRTPQATTA